MIVLSEIKYTLTWLKGKLLFFRDWFSFARLEKMTESALLFPLPHLKLWFIYTLDILNRGKFPLAVWLERDKSVAFCKAYVNSQCPDRV